VQTWAVTTETVPQQLPATKPTYRPDAGHVGVIAASEAVRSSCATPNTGWSQLDMVQQQSCHHTSNLGWWTLLPQHHSIQMSHKFSWLHSCLFGLRINSGSWTLLTLVTAPAWRFIP
jgi:hypothetical protein